jgi:hypothetical protein
MHFCLAYTNLDIHIMYHEQFQNMLPDIYFRTIQNTGNSTASCKPLYYPLVYGEHSIISQFLGVDSDCKVSHSFATKINLIWPMQNMKW